MRPPETTGLYRLTPDGERPLAELETARTFWSRIRGLLGRTQLAPGKGLLLDPCHAIHTFGMQFPIDVIFLTRDHRVAGIHRDVGPMRIVHGGPQAGLVVEVQAGWLPTDAVSAGDQLVMRVP